MLYNFNMEDFFCVQITEQPHADFKNNRLPCTDVLAFVGCGFFTHYDISVGFQLVFPLSISGVGFM